MLLAVDLSLRVLPFGWLQRLTAVAWKGAEDPHADQALPTVQRLQRLVGIAGRYHLHPMRCLQRALVLQWLLGRRSIRAELRIGARTEAGRLYAHAWLEHDGQPVGEPQGIANRFAPLVACEGNR